jgi:hypothetical protein
VRNSRNAFNRLLRRVNTADERNDELETGLRNYADWNTEKKERD